MNKKEIAVIIVGVIIIAAAVFIGMRRPVRPAAVIKNIPAQSLPGGFPVGLPMESGVAVADNYNSVSADGRVQATRAFESKKSPQENFVFYKIFLMNRQSGWTFLNEVNDPKRPDHKALFARSGYGFLSVNISARGANASIVEISFLANKK